MNQNKIGKFIAKVRKDKRMTQQELADLLNVTDRAISNWENGRRMPDVSLFKPLCEILDISMSELVNGERIEKDNIMKTSEETLMDTIHANQRNKIKFKYTICFLLFLFFSFCLLYFLL